MNISTRDIIFGYGQWVTERMEAGFSGYFMTFMFNPLPGSGRSRKQLMEDEVSRTYAKLLTRIFRDPNKEKIERWPMWLASPDMPVFKHSGNNIHDVTINDGMHYHAIALVPPENRLGMDLKDFLDENPKLLAGRNRYLSRIHVEPISDRPEYVTDYALKALKTGAAGSDDLLILPETHSERPNRTRWERKQAKVDGAKRRLNVKKDR